jgi:alpha-galactosidase
MWSILAAPLMIGCDIRKMTDDTKRILTNPEVIAVDQDKRGAQGYRVARTASTDVWKKPLTEGALAVALLNRDDREMTITANWKDLKLKEGSTYAVRDLWDHKDLGVFKDSVSAKAGPHATVLLKLTPVK